MTDQKPREFFDPSKVISTKKTNDCPDCAIRVETYLKSIEEWKSYNQKLRADLDLAIEALKKAKEEIWNEHHEDACAPAGFKIIKETLAKLQETRCENKK